MLTSKKLSMIFVILAMLSFKPSNCENTEQNTKEEKCGMPEIILEPEEIFNFNEGTIENKETEKDWNFIVYMAANNDLYKFAEQNLLQMLKVGSNKNINILVQLDVLGENEVTRFYVEKNNSIAVDVKQDCLEGVSGTPENLFDFAKWAITNYPAKHQALILWNHGSGIEDPHIWGKMYSHKLDSAYKTNPTTGLLEFNKTYIKNYQSNQKIVPKDDRGIAFNDYFETYLTNQDIKNTLNKISTELLDNKKIDILGMDACNMAMIEVASQMKDSVHFMVGSQEYEPGSGWQYVYVLSQFRSFFGDLFNTIITPYNFAKQIVGAYELEYDDILAEYTQSSINLEQVDTLEKNVSEVAELLIQLINKDNSVMSELKKIRRSRYLTTEFGDTNYIDLLHFYKSLKSKINKFQSKEATKELALQLETKLTEGLALEKTTITDNASGINYPEAHGLSIYLPKYNIHDSYYKTVFGKTNKWINFLELFTQLY